MSLIKNTPANVQLQRLLQLERVSDTGSFGRAQDVQQLMNRPLNTCQTAVTPFVSGSPTPCTNLTVNLSKRLVEKNAVPRPYWQRPQHKLVMCKDAADEVEQPGFTAKPHEDIPRNRLTQKLQRGIQNYVQRLQKREGFRLVVKTQAF